VGGVDGVVEVGVGVGGGGVGGGVLGGGGDGWVLVVGGMGCGGGVCRVALMLIRLNCSLITV